MPNWPIRTYTLLHPAVGTIQFSVPIHSPEDVEVYAKRILADLPVVESFTLANELVKRANAMWAGFALWVGDPVQARYELRQQEDVAKWLDTEKSC